MVFSTRTLFLAIRGIDQTGRAFGQVEGKLTKLQKAQQKLAKSAYRMLFAGVAFIAFGAMAGKALIGTLEHTTRGSRALSDLSEVFDRFKTRIGERIIDKFGDQLTEWIDKIDTLSDAWVNLIADLSVTFIEISFTLGVGLISAAVGLKFFGMLVNALLAAKWISTATATAVTAGATGALLTIGIIAILTIGISTIVWQLFPKKIKESIADLQSQAQAYADLTGVPVSLGYEGRVTPKGMKTGGLWNPTWTGREININTQNFFENVYTEADLDTLSEVISTATQEGVEATEGNTDPDD